MANEAAESPTNKQPTLANPTLGPVTNGLMASPAMAGMHVGIVLFDGFDNLDAIGPFEVFNHAREYGADITVTLYTHTPQDVVTSSHGLRVEPDAILPDHATDAAAPIDLLVVPGGGWGNRAETGAWGEVERGDLPRAITRFHDQGATIASVCTGGMLLAAAGLTHNRPAITHHGAIDDLADTGAQVIDARVVDAGDLITAGGVTAGIDLALHLLNREFGDDVAEQVAAEMEYDPRGDVYTDPID